MRLGMMQPYFFPYVGYFGLIHRSDTWVVFDTAQYIRRGWVNRNRVLTSGASVWKYVRVPIEKADVSASIGQVRVDNRQPWKRDLLNGLETYRLCGAPYYDETILLLENTLAFSGDGLNDLLVHCLKACCERLELDFRPVLFSEMKLPLSEVCGPGDWATETARALGATEYVNPLGGQSLFDPIRFQQSGISLRFLQHRLPVYQQRGDAFVPGLSIIDVLMWNSPQESRKIVTDYDLVAGYEAKAA